jgi:hypothetical protein
MLILDEPKVSRLVCHSVGAYLWILLFLGQCAGCLIRCVDAQCRRGLFSMTGRSRTA